MPMANPQLVVFPNISLNLNYFLTYLFEPLHSRLFQGKEHVLLIIVSITFSTGLAYGRNAILCHVKKGRRWGGGRTQTFSFFDINYIFFNRNLSKLQHSLLFLSVQSELNMLVQLFWMTKDHGLKRELSLSCNTDAFQCCLNAHVGLSKNSLLWGLSSWGYL